MSEFVPPRSATDARDPLPQRPVDVGCDTPTNLRAVDVRSVRGAKRESIYARWERLASGAQRLLEMGTHTSA